MLPLVDGKSVQFFQTNILMSIHRPAGWAFFVGLLQAAYTLTGYGMVAAMAEEVQNPEREVPKAIVLSVAAAGVTGVIYLIPILFVLPDVQMLLDVANGQPIGLLFKTVTGSAAGGFGLLFLILGILFFAGVGALTAASRCTYAFARDGAIPGSRLWKQVDKRFDIPMYALMLSTAVDMLLGLIYFGSSAAFNSFTGVATICLSTSYGMPILISVLRGRKAVKHSSYSLGKFGYFINIATLCWIVLAVVLFCMPVSIPVEAPTMNYASVVFAGFAMISVIWYFVRGRKDFTGPPVPVDVAPGESIPTAGLSTMDSRAERNGDLEGKLVHETGHTLGHGHGGDKGHVN
jgi:amino acid transporter